jgi:hypothetical protein
MRITKVGTDYISLNENNFSDQKFQNISRVHLIKLDFQKPTRILIDRVLHLFPKTNRFIIEDNIREYNSILKRTSKKYYVMNKIGVDIITFFRKNNKILINFNNLSKEEEEFFLMDGIFEDVLKNSEVIAVNKDTHDIKMEVLDKWKGNVILSENSI